MGIVDSIIGAESGGNSNAVNPRSSASGAGQFLDGTWVDTLSKARPDLVEGKSRDEILALKTDPQLSRDMTEAYAKQNGEILSKNGLPVTPGTTYLAHFAGPQGAVKILQADPSASAGDILGPAVVKANPFLAGMTAQGLQAWAAKKMGATTPTAGVQTAAPQAAVSPTNAIPQQAVPIFPTQPAQQAAPQQQAAPEAESPFMPAQIPQAQIFFAHPKRISLASLINRNR